MKRFLRTTGATLGVTEVYMLVIRPTLAQHGIPGALLLGLLATFVGVVVGGGVYYCIASSPGVKSYARFIFAPMVAVASFIAYAFVLQGLGALMHTDGDNLVYSSSMYATWWLASAIGVVYSLGLGQRMNE